MKMNSIMLLGMDGPFLGAATEAARLAFPGAEVKRLGSLEEGLVAPPAPGLELLVMLDAPAADIVRANQAVDAAHLPRWGVVLMGDSQGAGGEDVLPREDWNAPRVARFFRAAAMTHDLRRENARFRGDLLAIGVRITHDFRVPLGGILSTAEVLQESLAEISGDDMPLVRAIAESADELTKLIQQVSLLAKASGRPPVLQRLNMGTAVGAAVARLEHRLLREGTRLVEPPSWPDVEGEVLWLEAIWSNLLENALQHGGEAARLELGWEPAEGQWRFWVRDHGSGVAPENQSMLFQPFHLLHQLNAARGLGLPLVQRLVELQGGSCGHRPRPDGGSEFFFWLPAPPIPVAPGREKSPDDPAR